MLGKQRLCALSFSWAAAGSVTGGPRASASAAVPAPRRGRHLKRRFADRTPDPPNQRLWAGPGARILTGRAGGPSLLPPPGVRFGGSAWGPKPASCQRPPPRPPPRPPRRPSAAEQRRPSRPGTPGGLRPRAAWAKCGRLRGEAIPRAEPRYSRTRVRLGTQGVGGCAQAEPNETGAAEEETGFVAVSSSAGHRHVEECDG